jgi:uncharacterized membrane protein YbhN (UPF0104 family)
VGKIQYNQGMRKFIIALLLLLGVLLIITRFTEVQEIYSTLQQGDWRFILLGFAALALWMANHGLSYQAVYRLLGIREETWHMIKVALALTSLWVPVEAAAIITLVYRGYTFWVPLFVGMAAFRQIPHESRKDPQAV